MKNRVKKTFVIFFLSMHCEAENLCDGAGDSKYKTIDVPIYSISSLNQGGSVINVAPLRTAGVQGGTTEGMFDDFWIGTDTGVLNRYDGRGIKKYDVSLKTVNSDGALQFGGTIKGSPAIISKGVRRGFVVAATKTGNIYIIDPNNAKRVELPCFNSPQDGFETSPVPLDDGTFVITSEAGTIYRFKSDCSLLSSSPVMSSVANSPLGNLKASLVLANSATTGSIVAIPYRDYDVSTQKEENKIRFYDSKSDSLPVLTTGLSIIGSPGVISKNAAPPDGGFVVGDRKGDLFLVASNRSRDGKASLNAFGKGLIKNVCPDFISPYPENVFTRGGFVSSPITMGNNTVAINCNNQTTYFINMLTGSTHATYFNSGGLCVADMALLPDGSLVIGCKDGLKIVSPDGILKAPAYATNKMFDNNIAVSKNGNIMAIDNSPSLQTLSVSTRPFANEKKVISCRSTDPSIQNSYHQSND